MLFRFLIIAVIIVARICVADEVKNTQPQIRDLGGGLFQVGNVTLDKNAHSITLPAAVQMTEGVIEYLLVTHTGKTHESAFVTEVEPFHLHTAMLLLGAKGSPESKGGIESSGQLTATTLKNAPVLKGDRVSIFVKWKAGGDVKHANAEDFVLNDGEKHNATRGSWTYNGSGFYKEGKFAAQIEGSFIAMVVDPTALINNPRPGHDNDSIWLVDPAKIPPKDTPIEITIQLEHTRP